MFGRFDLRLGDSRIVLRTLPDNSVDSCCCDPPYALDSIVKRWGGINAAPARPGTDGAFARASAGFMGQEWDTGDTAHDAEFWREVWRVLKPGSWLVASAGTRTQHRMVCAIEDAGFIIDDQIAWVYGSGMPKSHKPSRYIERTLCRSVKEGDEIRWVYLSDGAPVAKEPPFRHPAANEWWGWGTAIKPAWEPICLAQKPMEGTIAEQVLRWGVGTLNIDACRILVEGEGGGVREGEESAEHRYTDRGATNFAAKPGARGGDVNGRWPANLCHDGSAEVLAAFPMSKGMRGAVAADPNARGTVNAYNPFRGRPATDMRIDDGSAARFFFSGKATKADRTEGARFENDHPTVKPVDLMRWLIRLTTPVGGIVLDPFMGSGSTGKAAMAEGMRFIGIDMTPKYLKIAVPRIFRAAMAYEVAPPQGDMFGSE